jgi:alpha-tubulin suppressor-like RCC1 family protein
MKCRSIIVSVTLGAIFVLPQMASASSIKTFQDISSAYYHSVAVDTEGNLYGWGQNNYSRFGTESMDDSIYTVPALLAGELDIIWSQAFANAGGVVALTESGEVVSWGKNSSCQTGQGELDTSLTLMPAYLNLDTDSSVIEITGSRNSIMGYANTFALTENGELWAWGSNSSNRLGDGTSENQCSPVKVSTDQNFKFVSSSITHTLSIDENGEIWGWGQNAYSEYSGEGPSKVPFNTNTNKVWTAVAAGAGFSFAIDINGALYVRGVASRSGIVDKTSFTEWTLVDDKQSWVEVKIGSDHILAKDSEGDLWGWGSNYKGRLGLGDAISGIVITPTLIPTKNKWLTVDNNYNSTSFAIASDHTLWGWGNNGYYNLGIGTRSDQYYPGSLSHQVTNKAVSVSAGYDHFMLLDAQGQLWGGQSQRNGRIGNGKDTSTKVVSPVPISSKVWSQVSSGGNFTVAIDEQGKLWGWGANYDKILANTRDTQFTKPIKLSDQSWQFISAGRAHFAAIRSDGTLWIAGNNDYGQLGTGDSIDPNQLTKVNDDTDWVDVHSRSSSTIALKNDGSLWGWGYNNYGELGLGYNGVSERLPVALNSGGDWKVLSQGAAGSHSLAVKNDGTLWAWGNNKDGKLGLSHEERINVPVQIGTKNDWASAVVGLHHSLVLKQDGRLYSFGDNNYGQLGNAEQVDSSKPVYISDGWKSIAATETFSVGIKENGDIYTWGALTLPDSSSSNVPVQYSYIDSDTDGIADLADSFPYDATETMDFDSDGIGDNADLDDDNDGFDDVYEQSNGSAIWSADNPEDDIDNDGYPLAIEYLAGSFDNSAQSLPSPQDSSLFSFENNNDINFFNLAGWHKVSVDGARKGVALATQTKLDNSDDITSISATFKSGIIAFTVKVSTELFDKFFFKIDGEVVEGTTLSGELDWQVYLVDISRGEHTLSWHYLKDDENAALEDTVWLTDIVLPLNLDVLDSDLDGMPDGWEYSYGFNPFAKSDANQDPDADGLTNLQEFLANTHPLIADTDGDGLHDGYEIEMGLDPTSALDGLLDSDNDGLTNLEEYQHGTNPFDVDSDGDGISDVDEIISGSDPLDHNIFVGLPNRISIVNDANGDGVKDSVKYVLSTLDVDVTLISGVDASELAHFNITHNYDSARVIMLNDRNADSIDEIGIFGFDSEANRYQLIVHDAVTGSKLDAWNWPATLGEVKFQVLADLTGDGIQEYAISGVHLANGTQQLVVKDGVSKSTYQTFKWPNLWDSPQFLTMSDVTFDNVPEVALYGRHSRLDKGQLFIYDGANANNKVDVYNWNNLWSDIQLLEMDDVDGDGTIDWGQFGQRKDDGRYQWLVKKGSDKRGVIRTFSWPNDLVDVTPMLVADRTGDGIREVAVLGTSPDSGKVFLRINDGRLANQRIANISWPASWEDIQVSELGDLNNDGFSEFGLLGFTKNNRTVQLIVRDGQTAIEYGRYTLPGRWESLSLAHYDMSFDGIDDVVIHGINQTSRERKITVLDGSSLLELMHEIIN